jgi:AcrR family transcriptional regulator
MSERVRVDGRTARAQRTRAAIVDAHLGLLASGDLKPTGERIADAAGVSLRTLWTSFKDMETLFSAAGQRLIERQLEVFEPIDAALPLADRVDAFCRQRARMLTGRPRGRALRAVLGGAAAQPDDRARPRP